MRIRTGFPGLLPLIISAMALGQSPQPTADYQGTPFVTEQAPVLRFERRTAPHPRGIDYPFKEQTARGAALFSRFPEFSLSDRRIHISGPWYNNPAANGHFTHGITSVESMPNYRQGPADISKIPYERKWLLETDPFWWGYAVRLADQLEKANPADPRIGSLRTFGKGHKFVRDREAFIELGRHAWLCERIPQDEQRKGVKYPCIDIEGTEGWEHQRDCFGWMYEGIADAASKNGIEIVPITYGQWTFSVGAVHESMRQGGKGDPEYLLPERDFLASPDPTLRAVNASNGVVSMDGYLQAVWGWEPFYKRNADDSLVLVNGQPVFNDLDKTTVYGIEVPLEKGEAERTLQDMYRQAVRMYLMYHRLAGEYPSDSTQKKEFLRNVRIGAWSRFTNEGVQGIVQNDRPLPSWQFEMLIGMYLVLADDVVVWSSDFNTPPGPLGADYTKTWKYNAHGVVEFLIKALHRYSALDPIHKGEFKWCWFSLPMVNKNQTEGDRYFEKPLAFAKLREFEGRPWIEVYAAWPGIDFRPAKLTLWVEKAGQRSPEYAIELANGRSYFYDGWELPASAAGADGKDVYLQFTDQLGRVRIQRGDWRIPAEVKPAD